MNPISLVGVVLGQPDSHLCQLPLVLLLLHQFNTTQCFGSGMLAEIPDIPGFGFFLLSRNPDSTTKKEPGKNKSVVTPFLVAINCQLFNFFKQVQKRFESIDK
jgi:hypothetical protein